MRFRGGQIAVVLAFVLAALALLALLSVDVFVAVREKYRLQNGGDAAAIAAAREQGAILNAIGRLNLDHLAAALEDRTNDCRAIVLEQRRKALLEPVEALRTANEAAKKNGMEVREEFANILRRHVQDIRLVYCGMDGGDGDPYPEPFPGAWTEYATAIDQVVADGLATCPDNMEFYDAAGGHLLLQRQFYHAIAARDWCWFFFHCHATLQNYDSYHDWNPLPRRGDNPLDNSEIFSLHLVSRRTSILGELGAELVKTLIERHTERQVADEEIAGSRLLADPEEPWFFFDGAWRQWFEGLHLAGDEDGWEFPLVGEIKPEYNVRGCAAICRVGAVIDPVAVEGSSELTWSAAAKPFGTVTGEDGVAAVVTALGGFVVPCLDTVRMVPLDSVGGENLATADYGWMVHIRDHLPLYLERGPYSTAGCYWCLQLQAWENRAFRRGGVEWLRYNSGSCRRGTGGPGGSGGTSHGH